MKKIKFEDKLEVVFESFFENGKNSSDYLERFSREKRDQINAIPKSANKRQSKNILNLLKQFFLFLPATFFTFYTWMGMMIFGFPTNNKILFLFLLTLSPFFMVFGNGNVRNIKHWMMPLAVIITGTCIGLLTSGFPLLRQLMLNFDNAVLIFPLALVIAVLSRNLVEYNGEK